MNKRDRFSKISLLLSASIVTAATGAAAQEKAHEEPIGDSIIVTATKREQPLLDVPISITAFGAAQIEQLRPDNLEDLSYFVPNMYLPPANESQSQYITIRGLDSGVARSSGRSVGIYIDGVYASADNLANMPVSDIARIEILKGPQGTLFGRDTIGGAINVTTRKPDSDFGGFAQVEVGNYGRRVISGGMDIPLVADTLALRVSARKLDTSGYIENEFNGEKTDGKDQFSGRAQLYFTPNEQFDARLVYTHSSRDDHPTTGENQRGTYSDDIPYLVNINQRETFEQDTDSVSLSMNYEFKSGHTLTSITGWSKNSDSSIVDRDLTPDAISTQSIEYEVEDISQEIRLTSPNSDRFDYLLGVYYLHSDTENRDLYPLFGAAWLANIGYPPLLPDVVDGQQRDFTTKSFAAFAHGNFYFNDKFSVFGGVRYTIDKKDITYSAFGEIFGAFGFTANNLKSKTKDDPIAWTAGLRFKPIESLSTYASVSRGYRSASVKDDFITAADLLLPDGFATRPEFVTSYEVGAKFLSDDGKLSANLALFYMDYSDIQVSVSLPPLLFVRQLVNAAEAHIEGVEADFSAALTPSLRLSGSAGYLLTRYDEFMPDPSTDLSGSGFGNAPKWTANVALDYEQPIEGVGDGLLHVDYALVTGPGAFVSNPAFDVVSGYSMLNAFAGLAFGDDRWRVTVWGKNLLDSNEPISSTLWGAGLGLNEHNVYIYQEPRTFGGTIKVAF